MKSGAKRAGRGGRRILVVRWRPETTKLRAATTLARGWVRIAPRPGYHPGDPRRGDEPAVTAAAGMMGRCAHPSSMWSLRATSSQHNNISTENSFWQIGV